MSRDYKDEYKKFQSSAKQRRARSNRNKARRKLKNAGVNIGGRDVDHRDGNPMNNSRKNLRAISKSKNRAKK